MVDVVGDESSPLLFYWGSGRSGGLILIFILPSQFPFRMLSSFCSWTLRSSALSFLRIRMPQELLWRRTSSICVTKWYKMHILQGGLPNAQVYYSGYPRVILGFLGLVFGNPHPSPNPSADAPCHPSWPGTFACPSHRRHRICRTDRSICLSICLPIDPPSRHQNGVLPQSSSIFTMFYHFLWAFGGSSIDRVSEPGADWHHGPPEYSSRAVALELRSRDLSGL